MRAGYIFKVTTWKLWNAESVRERLLSPSNAKVCFLAGNLIGRTFYGRSTQSCK